MPKPLYSPADSLRYVFNAWPLDWVSEQLCDQFANDDDNFDDPRLEEIFAAVNTAIDMLRKEILAHELGGATYSNGVPVLTHYSEPAVDDEGNQFLADYAATNHPGTGQPFTPSRKDTF